MAKSRLIKVTLLGDSKSGKTSIANRYLDNKFEEGVRTTVGVDYFSKKVQVGEGEVTLQVWDTAGQERFGSFLENFIIGSDVCVLVFDLTNGESFANIPKWLARAKEPAPSAQLILVGNKYDNGIDLDSLVPQEEIKQFANDNAMSYIEVSAKDNNNIDKLFTDAAELVLQKDKPAPEPKKGTDSDSESSSNSKDQDLNQSFWTRIAASFKRNRSGLLIMLGVALALASVLVGIFCWPVIVATTMALIIAGCAFGASAILSAVLIGLGAFGDRIWGNGRDGSGGDPVPAKNVASEFGMSPINIYKGIGAQPGKSDVVVEEGPVTESPAASKDDPSIQSQPSLQQQEQHETQYKYRVGRSR